MKRRSTFTAWRFRLAAIVAVLGPGFITANVDNDPGGILIYSQAGAQWGHALLWTLVPTTVALIVVQEMAARMGVVTGKGLSDLIREEFGLRATFVTLLLLGLADMGNIAAEFAGIASGLGIFGVSKYICVPAGALLVWAVIVRGSYKAVEKVLVLFSFVYFSYIVSAFFAHPNWRDAVKQTVLPQFPHSSAYLILVIGLVGTTITPWMQFYLQASIVEKGIRIKDYALTRLDVIIGCIMTDVVAFFIVVACAATLFVHGVHDISDAAQAATALVPLAGRFAGALFAVGLVNAALLSAAILPLATAYNICEGMGFESGVEKSFGEAREFYWLYTALIAVGAGLVLMPHVPLIKLMLYSQVFNGVLLPFVLFYMLKLVNRHDIMGTHTNGKLGNMIAIATAVIMVILSAAFIVTQLIPGI